MPSNYPDTTFGGDPSAPWNEEAYRACGNCSHYCESSSTSDVGICERKWWRALSKVLAASEAAECITYYDEEGCEDWEEA